MTDNQSTWALPNKRKFKPLKGEVTADVAIIGGGLAGVLAAYELAIRGVDACLLEAGKLGEGITTYTTGFLTSNLDTDLPDLIKMFGSKTARLAWESHLDGIARIGEIAKIEGIECEFVRCPSFTYAADESQAADLKPQQDAAKKLGFKSQLAGPGRLNFPQEGAWVLPKHGKYHAIKFHHGVVDSLVGKGVKIFEGTEVKGFKRDGGMFNVKTAGGNVKASQVITATYKPFNNPKEVLFKKGMYISYVMEVRIPKGMLEEGIYEDMANPYNYFRIDPFDKFDRMVIGGQDHRKEIPMNEDKNYAALEEVLRGIMGSRRYSIKRRWSSRVLEPTDGLALIGEVNPGEYLATAFSGNGMTYSAISGKLLADLITKRPNPYKKIYDPTRLPSLYQLAKKGRDYTEELIGGAGKNLFKDPDKAKSAGK